MSAAFLAFLAAVLAGLGARDQMLLAGLAARRMLPAPVLIVAIVTGAGTAVLAAKAAVLLAPLLSEGARLLFAGIAAVISGVECLALRPPRAPAEPTRSLAAHAIVLVAHQLTDAARFLIFAVAVATAAPSAAALGGAGGSVATVLIGALAGDMLAPDRLTWPRRGIGLVLVLVGAVLLLRSLH